MSLARRTAREAAGRVTRSRKVTYSLPVAVVEDLDRRAPSGSRGKSLMVAEALAFYFAEQDRQALEAEFAGAARDRLFVEDNASIQKDFAELDGELSRDER